MPEDPRWCAEPDATVEDDPTWNGAHRAYLVVPPAATFHSAMTITEKGLPDPAPRRMAAPHPSHSDQRDRRHRPPTACDDNNQRDYG